MKSLFLDFKEVIGPVASTCDALYVSVRLVVISGKLVVLTPNRLYLISLVSMNACTLTRSAHTQY